MLNEQNKQIGMWPSVYM